MLWLIKGHNFNTCRWSLMYLLLLSCPWWNSSGLVKDSIDNAAALAAFSLNFKGGTRGKFSLSSTISGCILSVGVILHFSVFRSCFLCFEVKNFLLDFLGKVSSSCNWFVTRAGKGSLVILFRLLDLLFTCESRPAEFSSIDALLLFRWREVSIPRNHRKICSRSIKRKFNDI